MVAINEKLMPGAEQPLPAGNYYLLQDTLYRAVALTNSSGAVIAQYTYNAMGYRITESYPLGGTGIPAGEVNYIYYNSNWQAIETRTDGTAAGDVASQTVWSAAYINAAVLQDTYSAGTIQPNSRIYFLQDADWNTTAIVGLASGNWQVVQRYVYSPYGTITVLNADWSATPTGTQPSVSNLYQGMTLDSVTGLYDERFRNYSPELGTWISQDPAGYVDGADTYQFVQSSPAGNVDATGLQSALQQYLFYAQAANDLQRVLPSYSANASGEAALLRGVILAARIKAADALQSFYNHHGESPAALLRNALEKLRGALEKCPVAGHGGADKALKRVKEAMSLVKTLDQINSGNPLTQLKGLGGVLGEIGGLLGKDSGAGPIIKFYGNAMSSVANALRGVYTSAGERNLGGWLNNGGPVYSDPQNAALPFTPAWANHVMQNAGSFLGPNQPAFNNALESPTQYEVVPGGING